MCFYPIMEPGGSVIETYTPIFKVSKDTHYMQLLEYFVYMCCEGTILGYRGIARSPYGLSSKSHFGRLLA